MAKKKYYVGARQGVDGRQVWEIFSSDSIPTRESHGKIYLYVIGAFQTKRGALFMAYYGQDNPHCQDVASAERLAKMYA